MERETSFRGVRIDGKRTPAHLVGAWRQRFQADPHGVAADLRFALIDPRAAGVRYLHGAESRLELLRECERDLVRRRGHLSLPGAADVAPMSGWPKSSETCRQGKDALARGTRRRFRWRR